MNKSIMFGGLEEHKDGEPCSHRGCRNHTTHPCEGCGRIMCDSQKTRKYYYKKYFSSKPYGVLEVKGE